MNYTVTGLILMGGSDRIASIILKSSETSGAEEASQRPIEVTGKLILDSDTGKKLDRE